METTELKIECELLKRTNKNMIMGLLVSYILFYLSLNFLTPTYVKGKLVYQGLLMQYGMEDSILYINILQLALLIFIGSVFWQILNLSLKIKGVIIISENAIEIIRWKKFRFYFRIDNIKNLKVQFNYFKKNDIEPRSMVLGNNNIIEFTRFNKRFKYEFLLQTEEEDEKFRAIMETWQNKNIQFDYKTVLADF